MPVRDARVGHSPAEPDGLAFALARKVDQPHLDVSQFDPHLPQVGEQALHPVTDAADLRLSASRLGTGGRIAIGIELTVHLGVGRVESPLLDGQLQEDGAHLRHQGVCLLDGVGASCRPHRVAIVAGVLPATLLC